MALKKLFGQRLSALRVSAGMSHETLARACGVSVAYIEHLEQGDENPTLDIVETLATGLSVGVEELLRYRQTEREPIPLVSEQGVVMVPFANDGTLFHPGLRRQTTRCFVVGTKMLLNYTQSFNDALEYLRAMSVAKWLRPNSNGNWGIVSAVRWEPLPDKRLWNPKVPTQ